MIFLTVINEYSWKFYIYDEEERQYKYKANVNSDEIKAQWSKAGIRR